MMAHPRPPLADAGAVSPTTPLLPSPAAVAVGGEESTAAVMSSSYYVHLCHALLHRWCLAPFLDERGSLGSVATGVVLLGVVGTLLGVVATATSSHYHDDDGGGGNSDVYYPYISSSLGYTYFLMWSVSFYPQVLTNYRRRSTAGLSIDFCLLNVIGFACYATYNLGLFYNPTIRRLYRDRHGGDDIPVRSNDVAFAVHALILASVTLCQILYYDGIATTKPSPIIIAIIVVIAFLIGLYPVVMILWPSLHWDALDFIYLLSYIKMAITVIKYTPQVILNYQRQSTVGWSIWQIVLDFGGGFLSDLQLIFDCAHVHNWSGLTGNLAKLALGLVSIVFDIVFMIQHYLLYGGAIGDRIPPPREDDEEQRTPLLAVEAEAAVVVVEDGEPSTTTSTSHDAVTAAPATGNSAEEADERPTTATTTSSEPP
jgi:cystinosin